MLAALTIASEQSHGGTETREALGGGETEPGGGAGDEH